MQKQRVFFVTLDDEDNARLRTHLVTAEQRQNGFFWRDSTGRGREAARDGGEQFISRWMLCDSWDSGYERLMFVVAETEANPFI